MSGSFTQRLIRSAARARKKEESTFPRKEPCHDCAFRPGSPERADPKAWAALLAQTDPNNGIHPFHCHFTHEGAEMPVDADGTYVPKRDRDGRPVGFPMCAGWADTFNVKLERLRDADSPKVGGA